MGAPPSGPRPADDKRETNHRPAPNGSQVGTGGCLHVGAPPIRARAQPATRSRLISARPIRYAPFWPTAIKATQSDPLWPLTLAETGRAARVDTHATYLGATALTL